MTKKKNYLDSEELKQEILKLDVHNLTPIDALNELYKLWKKASE